MEQLFNTTIEKETADGTVTKHVFQIKGKEADYSSDTILFKIYDTKIKMIARDPNDPMKITGETIYFDGVRKDQPIPDSNGGNALGRKFLAWGASAKEVADSKKAAGWYTFLFGEVTFPGKAPLLVNYRLTGRLGMTFGEEIKLDFDKAVWPSKLIEIKIKGTKDKSHIADLSFKVKEEGLAIQTGTDALKTIQAFVQDHNDKIISKQKAA